MGSKSSPNSSNSSTPIVVKKENPEDVKEYAETAMNELLGWYGYERVELRRWETARANSGSPESSSRKSPGEHKDGACSWCNNEMKEPNDALSHLGAKFCSEICFSQSRRANFKRAKTCDWCRHVRHTVSYVDFQEGPAQLQFCSEKCLNQYKMHIFCRETQAHIDLHPHLQGNSSGSNLITPELWLKNCRSRSNSPSVGSDRGSLHSTDAEKTEDKPPKVTIKITPASKLDMKRKPYKEIKNKPIRITRKRRPSRCSSTVTSQSTAKTKETDINLQKETTQIPVISPPRHSSRPIPPLHPFTPSPNTFNHSPRFNFMQDQLHYSPFSQMALGQPPPVTIMVPYPVILPIPLPIPVPIPLPNILQAMSLPKERVPPNEDTDVPLDCTIHSKKVDEPIDNRLDEPTSKSTEESAEQTLPKFKITRLSTKMAKIVQKDKEQTSPESMRPLRKRRRLVEVNNDDEVPIITKSRKVLQV